MRCSTGEGEFTWNSNPYSSCIASSFSFSSSWASDSSTVSTLGVLLSFVEVGSGGLPVVALFMFTLGSSVFWSTPSISLFLFLSSGISVS